MVEFQKEIDLFGGVNCFFHSVDGARRWGEEGVGDDSPAFYSYLDALKLNFFFLLLFSTGFFLVYVVKEAELC